MPNILNNSAFKADPFGTLKLHAQNSLNFRQINNGKQGNQSNDNNDKMEL